MALNAFTSMQLATFFGSILQQCEVLQFLWTKDGLYLNFCRHCSYMYMFIYLLGNQEIAMNISKPVFHTSSNLYHTSSNLYTHFSLLVLDHQTNNQVQHTLQS